MTQTELDVGLRLPEADAPERAGMNVREWFAFVAGSVAVAWAIGVFRRFTFDDEVFTLRLIERFTPGEIINHLTSGVERHGPLSTLMYELLDPALSTTGKRFVALLLVVVGFGVILDLTLRALEPTTTQRRYVVAGGFVLFPLLYGAGDALRSYPLTASLIALFGWAYLRNTDRLSLGAAVPLGLAAATTVTPIVAYLAFAVDRYVIRRTWTVRDIAFHVVLAVSASPGLVNTLRLPADRAPGGLSDPTESVVQFAVGFLGGMRVGLSQAPLLVPAGLIAAVAMWQAWKSRNDGSLLRGRMIQFGLTLVVISLAFILLFDRGQARTYLYLGPFVVAVVALGLLPPSRGTARQRVVAVVALMLAFTAFAANYHGSLTPLKRNLAIPYPDVQSFVAENVGQDTLVVTDDGVLAHYLADPDLCVITERFTVEELEDSPFYLPPTPECYNTVADYSTVMVIETWLFDQSAVLAPIAEEAKQTFALASSAVFGEDRDASLKERLGSIDLPRWLLRARVYQR